MRVEAWLFGVLGLFFIPVTVVYWYLSYEWVGTVALIFTALFGLMIGYYLWFTARRLEPRPEDRPDAEIADGAGEVGFFAPHSWWPIVTAFGAATLGLGLVIGPFLALIGVGIVLVAVSGMVFEFYVGINRSQGMTVGQLQERGLPVTSNRKFLGD